MQIMIRQDGQRDCTVVLRGARAVARGKWWAALTAFAVLGTGAGLWVSGSWPFKESYCWGAWQAGGADGFLGDEALEKSGSERSSEETSPPGKERPHGKCTVTVRSEVPDGDAGGSISIIERITVRYGPVPEKAGSRRAWIDAQFAGSGTPLPDGLPGFVAGDHAMAVLPEECDVDGRPTAVTLTPTSHGDGHLGRVEMPFSMGSYGEITQMLLSVANTGMKSAGCAPDEPWSVSSPFVDVAEDDDSFGGNDACRIDGVDFRLRKGSQYQDQVGTVGDRLQTCTVFWTAPRQPDETGAQFVMVSQPRLAAVFDGLPEQAGAASALKRVECAGRPTYFYMHLISLQPHARPDGPGVFARFEQAVQKRIGCETGDGTDGGEA
ncbi:hypothetical protein ACIBI4_00365 [Streptomyces sp. NPDC050418]|uniref:hypothetical protein n=1 Tax=Streptomyces sp. NPDC050418 TaxID=3365612 RepID=UPI0037B9DFFF